MDFIASLNKMNILTECLYRQLVFKNYIYI